MEIDTQTKPHAIEVFKKKKLMKTQYTPYSSPIINKESIRGWLLWKREWVGGWVERGVIDEEGWLLWKREWVGGWKEES